MEEQKEAAQKIKTALDALQQAIYEAANVGVHAEFVLFDSFTPPHQVPHAQKIFVVL